MPNIFDNMTPNTKLLPALEETLTDSLRADFCVGYFKLRGWAHLAPHINRFESGLGEFPCRVLVGMQKIPHDEHRDEISIVGQPTDMDNKTAIRLREKVAEQFRQQLIMGAPSNTDERTLRQLTDQLRAGKVIVKLFLRYPLHAKLYLLYRSDKITPIIGYLGSSNLSHPGLTGQGELNIDVVEQDASKKLEKWFNERWNDRFCMDITKELTDIIEESWVRRGLIPPYHIYLKMAYYLSREARTGLTEYKIPPIFGNTLFDFQAAAVKIAAHHIAKRGGVLIGDVVGLGKTIMATAVASIIEDDYGFETLIISPKNLTEMWDDYAHRYRLRAKVISISKVINELPNMRRYRLVIIDESHNLRNREGKRYKVIQEYVRNNDSKCILLSATPYNKTYKDLSSQLRIFIDEEQDIGVRPEKMLRELGEVEFGRQHQASPRTLAAFEHSQYPDDWRDLMRLYLVRRTRSFIRDNYAETDPNTGRKFLTYEDGRKSFFPIRVPKTVKFTIDDSNTNDQYALLYSPEVVDIVNKLKLPRYGLGNYVLDTPPHPLTPAEKNQIENLSKAGHHLIGVCRTNLFKRLESGGSVFLLSVERHLLRDYVFLHAIHNNLPLPIGTQDVEMLDSRFTDADENDTLYSDDEEDELNVDETSGELTIKALKKRAAEIYDEYQSRYKRRFHWIRSDIFTHTLESDLQTDADALLGILKSHGDWQPEHDAKLNALYTLLTKTHPQDKVLIFSQFADTVRYLEEQLNTRGMRGVAGVTGDSDDPTKLAHHFSPTSNEVNITKEDELYEPSFCHDKIVHLTSRDRSWAYCSAQLIPDTKLS